MDRKTSNAVREKAYATIGELDMGTFELVGQTSEGMVFNNENGSFVVKIVDKADGYDANEAVAEFAEKVAKAEAKALEKAAKK